MIEWLRLRFQWHVTNIVAKGGNTSHIMIYSTKTQSNAPLGSCHVQYTLSSRATNRKQTDDRRLKANYTMFLAPLNQSFSCSCQWGHPSAKTKSPSLNLFSLLYSQTQTKWNRGFTEIWHCFTVPKCSMSRRDAGFKCHDQCTHWCECDNEHLTHSSPFLCQYHKSSLGILRRCPIQLVLVIMIVLAPYV